jgi:ATP-dependent DNA helicase RecG
LTIEFKSDSACLSDQDLLEAVVSFANSSGGTLLIGVENDGKITGLHKKDLKFPPSDLSAMVANRTVPPLSVDTQITGRKQKSSPNVAQTSLITRKDVRSSVEPINK